MKILIALVSTLLVACGSRIPVGEAVDHLANSDLGGLSPAGTMVDARFDGRDSNWKLVQDIVATAQALGAMETAKSSPQRVEVQDKVMTEGHEAHAVCVTVRVQVPGMHNGPARLIISKAVDALPRYAKKRIIAHELGHCMWNQDDLYGDSDKDDLMYGYGPQMNDLSGDLNVAQSIKAWKATQTQEYIDGMIEDFMAAMAR